MSLVTSTNKSQNDRIFIDSLPYVESVHQDYEDYALALIEEEMKQIQPRPLKKLPEIKFRTELMEQEFSARVVNNEFLPREAVSFQPGKIPRPSNLDDWREKALPQAKSRFEAERIRGLLLEAEKEEAVNDWKVYNSQCLEKLRDEWQAAATRQREAVEEVNFQRQQAQQQQAGPQLDQLSTDYQQILYRRNQLEHSIHGLKSQQT